MPEFFERCFEKKNPEGQLLQEKSSWKCSQVKELKTHLGLADANLF